MNSITIAFLVFIVLLFFSRLVLDKAKKNLSVEQKASLLDLFSEGKAISFAVVMVVVLFYYLSMKFQWFDRRVSLGVYMILLIVYILIRVRWATAKLKDSQFPKEYLDAYLLSSVIRVVAILLLFGIMGIDLF